MAPSLGTGTKSELWGWRWVCPPPKPRSKAGPEPLASGRGDPVPLAPLHQAQSHDLATGAPAAREQTGAQRVRQPAQGHTAAGRPARQVSLRPQAPHRGSPDSGSPSQRKTPPPPAILRLRGERSPSTRAPWPGATLTGHTRSQKPVQRVTTATLSGRVRFQGHTCVPGTWPEHSRRSINK